MVENEADDGHVFLYLGECLRLDEGSESLKVFDKVGLTLEIQFVALERIKFLELIFAEQNDQLHCNNGGKECQVIEIRKIFAG